MVHAEEIDVGDLREVPEPRPVLELLPEVLPDAKISYVEFATKEDVRTIIKEEVASFKNLQLKPRNYKEASK